MSSEIQRNVRSDTQPHHIHASSYALVLISVEIDGLTLYGTLKPHSSGPLYSNMVFSTLAVDGWAVTFGTARRSLGGLRPRPVPSSLYQM